MTAIVFDLDGTLIHSAPDIHAAVNRTLTDFDRTELSLETVTSFIGNGVPTLIARVIEARWLDPALSERMIETFLGHYNVAPADLTRPYDGLIPALEVLRDRSFRLGVCTNKPHEPTVAILRQLGLSAYFDVVIGGDSLPVRKPDPAPLLAAFERLGEGGLYVGDSEVDAECAFAAGVPFLLFTEGYRKTPAEELPHLAAFERFRDLPRLVSARELAWAMDLTAICFDVDGTLAETEEVHREAFNATFRRWGLGWDWDRETCRVLLRTTGGKERIAAWQAKPESGGARLSPDEIARLHREKSEEYGRILDRWGCLFPSGAGEERRVMNTLWLQSVGRDCWAMLLICAEYPELLELMEGTRLEFLWHPALSKTGGAEVRRTLADIREDRLALDISRVASSIVTGPNATDRCRVISF